MNKREIGNKGEDSAVEILIKSGYNILERNFFSRKGEIDIIAELEDMLVFVEVKYRKNKTYGTGEEAISYSKKRKMYLTAMIYVEKTNNYNKNMRFDVIAFDDDRYNWIKNCIWGDEIGL